MSKMFRYSLIIGLMCAEIAIVHTNAEDDVCEKSSKTFGRSECVVTSKCDILEQLAFRGKVVDCGIDAETGAAKICCPKSSKRSVRQVKGKDPYEIVRQKCYEYSSARYVTIIKPSPFPNRPNTTQTKKECVTAQPLITGGTAVKQKEFPHMALIGFTKGNQKSINNTMWLCGGTLISDRFVLTAAHCERSGEFEATWVRLGELVLHNDSDSTQPRDFRIMERIPHPDYKISSLYHDIMLLKLYERVVFTPYMRPICLYWSPVLAPALRNKALIAGWGATGADERQSNALLKATIEFAHDEECFKTYRGYAKLAKGYDPDTMVCAGNKVHGNDTCPGDSGGPLKVPIPDWTCMYSQVGITSFGAKICGQKDVSSVYTKVSTYVPWIQPIVWP